MKKPEKLTIRINFRREKDRRSENENLGHYHWGRILGVSIVVIVAIASLIGAGSYYLKEDSIDSKVVESAADKTIISPLPSLKKDSIEAEKQSPAEAETVSKKITAVEPAVAETAPTVITALEPASEETPAVAETIPEDLTAIKPATQKNTVSQGLFTQSQKNILSDNVTCFVISQAVESNEPIGTINDIEFDDNNIATVYAYSDVSALKDQTIYYQWSLNGKNIAKIRVKVGSNRWRSYSSKFIQPDMHGEWKVELQNQAGENIAINQFHY